jgi:hypothetical protein
MTRYDQEIQQCGINVGVVTQSDNSAVGSLMRERGLNVRQYFSGGCTGGILSGEVLPL